MNQPAAYARTAFPPVAPVSAPSSSWRPRAEEVTEQIPPVEQMSLGALVQCCIRESERYHRSQPHDTRFAYELFRRALAQRDEAAWERLYQLYRPMVEYWVRRHSAFGGSGESCDFFVGAAFTRFWRAISAENFGSFPNAASLLRYLRCCTECAVIDGSRRQSHADAVPEALMAQEPASQPTPDEEVLARVERQEFWQYLGSLLRNEAEQVVVHAAFVLGMKPLAIQAARPDLFASVGDVYNIKRNLLERLGRNQELRRWMRP